MHKVVWDDCRKLEDALAKDIAIITKRFLMPDLLGSRKKVLEELALKKQQLATIRGLLAVREDS